MEANFLETANGGKLPGVNVDRSMLTNGERDTIEILRTVSAMYHRIQILMGCRPLISLGGGEELYKFWGELYKFGGIAQIWGELYKFRGGTVQILGGIVQIWGNCTNLGELHKFGGNCTNLGGIVQI